MADWLPADQVDALMTGFEFDEPLTSLQVRRHDVQRHHSTSERVLYGAVEMHTCLLQWEEIPTLV